MWKMVWRPAYRSTPAATSVRTPSASTGTRRSAASRARRPRGPAAGAAPWAAGSATWDTRLGRLGLGRFGRDDLADAGPEARTGQRRPVGPPVVAPAEVVLQEDVEH